MTNYRFLRTETMRLSELQTQDLVNTPLEARFNRLARITRDALRVRAAAVSFIDGDREWFKAVTGWNVSELSRSRSLAVSLLGRDEPVIVGDTRADDRCRNHPLVTGAPGFRFCALSPLVDSFGNVLGAVAGYDTEPRVVSERLGATIEDLGQIAQRELLVSELGAAQQALLAKLDTSRRHAMVDELTRLWNRRGGLQLLDQALTEAKRGVVADLGVCIVDVDHFKSINDRHGHATGDAVLRRVASLLVDAVRPEDIVCRLGGDEFLLVFPGLGAQDLARMAERIRLRTRALAVPTRSGAVEVTLSIGGLSTRPGGDGSPEVLLHKADEALYRAKSSGRDCAILLDTPQAA
jgi:diguanylate cyclase (GGDEF)-like protein